MHLHRGNLPSQTSINTSNSFYIGCYQALVFQGNRNIGFSIRETTLTCNINQNLYGIHACTLYAIEIILEMCTVLQLVTWLSVLNCMKSMKELLEDQNFV